MYYLLDSAAYLDLMRTGVDPRRLLFPLVRDARLYNCGVVRAEVLRGMKVPRQHDELEAFFDIVPEVPTDARLWRGVTELGWELARKGRTPPVTDLAIAACALRVNATLVSPDAHFKGIPGLRLVPTLPGRG